VVISLPPVGAAIQSAGPAQDTEIVPGPSVGPATTVGPVQCAPSKWYARPASSTAMQELGLAQDTAATPVPLASGCGLPKRSVPGVAGAVVGEATAA
jgi:hypothetical protein